MQLKPQNIIVEWLLMECVTPLAKQGYIYIYTIAMSHVKH
jgi:hypothetical protein